MKTIRIGSVVSVRDNFGMGKPKKVIVLGISEKNGKPLFDYEDTSNFSTYKTSGLEFGKWAYFNQIDRIIKY